MYSVCVCVVLDEPIHCALQDLTRLEVVIPYLPHMSEDALKERKSKLRSRAHLKQNADLQSTTSFDHEAKVKMAELNQDSRDGKRDSTAR